MQALVTGASGFIGNLLVRRLVQLGHTVYCLRRQHQAEPSDRIKNIVQDLADPLDKGALPAHVDGIWHLAASTDAQADPLALAVVNIDGTARLLDWANECGARFFIFASTGGVCGYHEGLISEETPCRPTNNYSVTKYQAELLVQASGHRFTTAIMRLFFPYGPGQRGRFMPGLFAKVREGQPVTVYNGGANPRLNPIFVTDVVDILLKGASWPHSTMVNVAGKEVISVLALARTIGTLLGRVPLFSGVDDPQMLDLVADTRRLNNEWGFTPGTVLAAGLASMAEEGGRA